MDFHGEIFTPKHKSSKLQGDKAGYCGDNSTDNRRI